MADKTLKPFLVQLHWQNLLDISQTEFVAQGEFTDAESMHAWAREIIDRRRGEMPEMWTPLLMTEGCEHFVYQVPKK